MFFKDLKLLFRHVLKKDRVVVFGDLGRSPHVIIDYLSTHHSRLKISFVSVQYPLSIPNNVQQFHQIPDRDAFRAKCDVLVFLEPRDHAIVQANYPNAGSVVVFTSHAILDLKNDYGIETCIFFQSDRTSDRIRELTKKLEGTEESDDIQVATRHIAHPSVVTIGPETHCDVVLSTGKPPAAMPGATKDVFVVVDLTQITRPLSIFLYYLDAFDYMLENLDRVERWSVCFAPGGTRKYENFIQECIDRLHCSANFRLLLKDLLPLLSFYKSGTIDLTVYELPVSRIIQHEYISPDSIDKAFKAAITYDTMDLVGGVLSIVP